MKRHYVALDGLRGIAAVVVVAHHLQNEVGDVTGVFRAGYLSVDFFFALSGFVIAAAYEGKFARGMKLGHFMGVRLQRLYPMIFLGSFVGLACAALVGTDAPLGLALVSQLLLIPCLAGGGVLFLINTVYWSLLFELAANVVHALLFRWTNWIVLIGGVALSAVAAVVVAMKFGHLGGGWGLDNWWCGLVRVAFSYGVGVLIYRLHVAGRLPHFTAPLPILAVIFVGCIALASVAHAWWADVLAVIVAFPILLIAGINAPTGRSATPAAALGAVSYPLYATHGPLVVLWGAYLPHGLVSATAMLIAMVSVAFALDRWYDAPVRRFVARVTRPHLPPADEPPPDDARLEPRRGEVV